MIIYSGSTAKNRNTKKCKCPWYIHKQAHKGRGRTGKRRGHLLIQVPEPVGLFRQGRFDNMKRNKEAALHPGPSGDLTSKDGKLPTQLSAVQGLSPFLS